MFPDLPPSLSESPPYTASVAKAESPRNRVTDAPRSLPNVQCFTHAAEGHGIDPLVLLAVLKVEGGRAGEVAINSNGSMDLGPMSINTVWLPVFAKRLDLSEEATMHHLANDGCANAEAAAWILKQKIDKKGSVWEGVAHFHSSNPRVQAPYLKKVQASFEQIVRRFIAGLR